MRHTLIVFTVLLGFALSLQAQDSLNVRRVGELTMGDLTFAVVVQGNYAYVAADAAGLSIVDISNPEAPVEVGVYHTPGWAFGVAVSGDFAYLADYIYGLRIVNVADPTAPVEVGFYYVPRRAASIAISGNYAYLTCQDSGLLIVDVSNPATPTEVGHDTLGRGWGVAISRSLAYEMAGGLRIVDVSNPAAPTETGFYETHGSHFGVAVSGDYAYMAEADSGLRIVNVADPTVPLGVGVYQTLWAFDVAVSGIYAYVADVNSGLRIVEVTNPAAPMEAGYYETMSGARGVAVSGNYAYVAETSAFGIYDCSAALGTSRSSILHPSSISLSSYPNPFNSSTTLRLDLPREIRGRLVVYDVLGKEVNVLKDGMIRSGSQEISFDAHDLASGIYFVRMESGQFNATQKVMLVR
jgi:hypothetical protein